MLVDFLHQPDIFSLQRCLFVEPLLFPEPKGVFEFVFRLDVSLFDDLEGRLEGSAAFQQPNESVPKVFHDLFVGMLAPFGQAQDLLEGVIDPVCVNIQAMVHLINQFHTHILALQVFLIDLELLHCPQRTRLVHLDPQTRTALTRLFLPRVQRLVKPHLQKTTPLL